MSVAEFDENVFPYGAPPFIHPVSVVRNSPARQRNQARSSVNHALGRSTSTALNVLTTPATPSRTRAKFRHLEGRPPSPRAPPDDYLVPIKAFMSLRELYERPPIPKSFEYILMDETEADDSALSSGSSPDDSEVGSPSPEELSLQSLGGISPRLVMEPPSTFGEETSDVEEGSDVQYVDFFNERPHCDLDRDGDSDQEYDSGSEEDLESDSDQEYDSGSDEHFKNRSAKAPAISNDNAEQLVDIAIDYCHFVSAQGQALLRCTGMEGCSSHIQPTAKAWADHLLQHVQHKYGKTSVKRRITCHHPRCRRPSILADSVTLGRHYRTQNHLPEPVSCPLCLQKDGLSRNDALSRHLKRKDGCKGCKICSRKFKTLGAAKEHAEHCRL
ncbi:hypothetical protein OE88DRAFT_1736049 [Heliocybe sulcata]|uniref:Uncharacterized protein n=1 Tax=Heliocybe sulcata TaxID=5364 RepID=A0A5C3MYD4_9AGAM|nr:hypothetical protein OE88DRAFT_1736049 [Heliocybe sulcata]